MAKQPESEDLDLGEEKTGNKKLFIIIGIVAVLLIGAGVAAYFLLAGDDAEETSDASENANKESVDEVEKGPAQYYAIDPVFVVSLPGRPSLLQVGVNVRVNSDELVEFLKHNDPMVRHHLLNLLQTQDAKSLKTREAKEALQTKMLDELNRVIKELSGPGEVGALYFTSFVMQ